MSINELRNNGVNAILAFDTRIDQCLSYYTSLHRFFYQQSHHRESIKRSHSLNVHSSRSIKPILLIRYQTDTNLDIYYIRGIDTQPIVQRVSINSPSWSTSFLRGADFDDLRARRSLMLADFDDLGPIPGTRTNLSSTRRTDSPQRTVGHVSETIYREPIDREPIAGDTAVSLV